MTHKLTRTTQIAAACTLALGAAVTALPAMAADSSQHLRGQITSVSDSGFTMTTDSGDKRKVMLSSDAKIAAVTKGDLSNIEKGTFIGTANVKKNGQNQALEMVIFPPSMKGTGLGDYSWDLSPSMVPGKSGSQGSATASGSSMTNGTVSSKSSGSMSGGSSMTNGTVSSKSGGSMSSGSSMTNGTVSSKTSGSMNGGGSSMTNGTVTSQNGGGKMITLNVDYGKGSKKIVVPADVPTVKVGPGEKSDLKAGAHVFVVGPKSSGTFHAEKVIVGKNGVVPPM